MDVIESGVVVRDSFTGEIKDFFEFGTRVMLKSFTEEKAREVILLDREHTQIAGALFGAIDTEMILYLDPSEPEYDNNRRFIPIIDRTRRIPAFEIESIGELNEFSAPREEDVSF